MKPLSIGVVLFGLLALVQPAIKMDLADALLGGVLRRYNLLVGRDIELPQDIRRYLFN